MRGSAQVRRLVARFFFGGLLKYPPAMQAEMAAWLEGFPASKLKKRQQAQLAKDERRLKETKEKGGRAQAQAQGDLAALKEKPRAWGPYKEGVTWLHGMNQSAFHNGDDQFEPLDYKIFRSLPKDEKAKETARLHDWMGEQLDKQDERQIGYLKEKVQDSKDDIKKLNAKIPEGFDETVTSKEFDQNLEGWKYYSDDIREQAEKSIKKRLKKDLKRDVKFKKYLNRMVAGFEFEKDPQYQELQKAFEKTKETEKDEAKLEAAEAKLKADLKKLRKKYPPKKITEKDLEKIREERKETQKKQIGRIYKTYDKVTLALVPKKELGNAAAEWDAYRGIINLDKSDSETWEGSLKHELTHLAQSVLRGSFGYTHINYKGNHSRLPGNPGRRIRDPEVSQALAEKKTQKQLSEESLDEKTQREKVKERGIRDDQLHDLDDVEYYTELGDAVAKFNLKQSQWDWTKKDRALALSLFTADRVNPYFDKKFNEGSPIRTRAAQKKAWEQLYPGGQRAARAKGVDLTPNKAFKIWKEHNPGKWKKAVKELTKAVDKAEEASKGIQKLWDEFIDTKKDGGKALVPNPNPETKDADPEITVNYVMRQPDQMYETGRRKLRREFAQWRGDLAKSQQSQKRQQQKDEPQPKGQPKPEPQPQPKKQDKKKRDDARAQRKEQKRLEAKKVAVKGTDGIEWDLRPHGEGGQITSDQTVLWVDPQELDKHWAKSQRVGPKGEGGIGTRYKDFEKWLDNEDTPVQPPEIGFQKGTGKGKGSVLFENGRHRTAVMRDRGVGRIPVVINNNEVDDAMKAMKSAKREAPGTESKAPPKPKAQKPKAQKPKAQKPKAQKPKAPAKPKKPKTQKPSGKMDFNIFEDVSF